MDFITKCVQYENDNCSPQCYRTFQVLSHLFCSCESNIFSSDISIDTLWLLLSDFGVDGPTRHGYIDHSSVNTTQSPSFSFHNQNGSPSWLLLLTKHFSLCKIYRILSHRIVCMYIMHYCSDLNSRSFNSTRFRDVANHQSLITRKEVSDTIPSE